MGNRIRKVNLRRRVTTSVEFTKLKRKHGIRECLVLLGDLKNLNTRIFRPSRKMKRLLIYMKCKNVSITLKRVPEQAQELPPKSLSIFGTNYKKQVFKCKQCSEVFEDELKYKRHTTIHMVKRGNTSSKQLHTCLVCKKCFGSRNILWMHMRVHSQPQQLKCKECQESFKTSTLLQLHRSQCPKKLEFRVGNNAEIVQKESEVNFRYRCSVCLQKFRDVYEMRAHKESHWEKAPSSALAATLHCDICDDILKDEVSLLQHREFHRELTESGNSFVVSSPESPETPVTSNDEIEEDRQVSLVSNNNDAEEREVLVMNDFDIEDDNDCEEVKKLEKSTRPRIFVRNINDLMPQKLNTKKRKEPIIYRCTECNMQFKKRRSYRKHCRLAKMKFKCLSCSDYSTCCFANLRRHCQSVHQIMSICRKCRKSNENEHECIVENVTVGPAQI